MLTMLPLLLLRILTMSLQMASEESTTPITSINQLPQPVLVHILRHVPQQDRLLCCALVGRAWPAAAAEATTAVQVLARAPWFSSFEPWLKQHTAQVTKMQFSANLGAHPVCGWGQQRQCCH